MVTPREGSSSSAISTRTVKTTFAHQTACTNLPGWWSADPVRSTEMFLYLRCFSAFQLGRDQQSSGWTGDIREKAGRGKTPWRENVAEDFKAHMSNLKPLRAYPHSSCIMLAQTRQGNDQGNGFEGPKLLPTIYLEKTKKVLCNISERRRQKRSKHVTGMERKDLWETRRAETKWEPNHLGKQRKGWTGRRRKRTEGTLRLWPHLADLEDDSKPFVCYLLSSSYIRR